MTQKPFLVVLEYILYGDLKKVLKTLRDKEIILKPHEHSYIAMQTCDALAYSTSRILALAPCGPHVTIC